ncbi:ATP-binding protein [Pseudocolwellia sp. HL-MZ7]|uniref:ATP-binding protein n=1 Tax=Pseudocolwellia sp. HL-MZ7 TaxID=3400627 RepID=UPI003CED88C8
MNNQVMDSVLKVGEVCEVQGRVISVRVDKNKNLSELFYNGTIIKNVSVGSFIEIRKGFISLIGKVEGEKIIEDKNKPYSSNETIATYQRFLTISLSGFINRKNKFIGGSTELPLIGNEAYVLTSDKIKIIHNIGDVKENKSINIAETHSDNLLISLPIDGLMNTHMAIFGNTGSGKSNTLTSIYKAAYSTIEGQLGKSNFIEKCKFLLFDFNGEYTADTCITENKHVYDLKTSGKGGSRIPLSGKGILDLEVLSIICEATEKTQKPFLDRALKKYSKVKGAQDPNEYTRNILNSQLTNLLVISDKAKFYTIINYFHSILQCDDDIAKDLEMYSSGNVKVNAQNTTNNGWVNNTNSDNIHKTTLANFISKFSLGNNDFDNFLTFIYIQLVEDLIFDKAVNEHVRPVIGKIKQKQKYLDKVLDFSGADKDFWNGGNFVVISLDKTNTDIKKLIPLLVAKTEYDKKKGSRNNTSLNIIIDEAHNILSNESFRETESWKDHRLETFEEIIKEGRKFGVFLTISSQRPNDISNTITSQAHNYFIHRLVNERDLSAISKAVSYIDKITEESIPTLPTGVCIFSGISTQIPLKLKIKELNEVDQPNSKTFKFFL